MPNTLPYRPQLIELLGKWKPAIRGFKQEKHSNLIPVTRYQAMSVQRRLAPGQAMRACGLKPIPHPENDLRLTITSKGCKFSGVARCRSQFCLDCAQFAKEERIKKISNGLKGALLRGYKAYFLTLTTQRSHNPEEQIEALQSGWKALQDRVSYRLKKQGIKLQFVRGLDVTFRTDIPQIYHSHLHVIVVIPGDFQPVYKTTKKEKRLVYADVEDMFQRCWIDIQCKKGTVAKWEGQKMIAIEADDGLSRYLCKFDGLGQEVTSFHTKTGKQTSTMQQNKTIGWMQLVGRIYRGHQKWCPMLGRMTRIPNHQAENIYVRFLNAVKGRRTISMSRHWSKMDLPFFQPLAPWNEEEEPPQKIDIQLRLSTFWEIREAGADAFCVAAFNCVMESNILILYDLLDSLPDEEKIRSFIRTFG